MHSCHKLTSELHENDRTKTSAFAASSPILRAARSRSVAKRWLEMSILRQSKESSSSSQDVSQSVGRRFRGKPGHAVFCLSQPPTRWHVRLGAEPHLLPAPTAHRDRYRWFPQRAHTPYLSSGLGRHDARIFDVRRLDFHDLGEGSITRIR